METRPEEFETESEQINTKNTVTDVDTDLVSGHNIQTCHPEYNINHGNEWQPPSVTRCTRIVPSQDDTCELPSDGIDVSDIQALEDCNMMTSGKDIVASDLRSQCVNTKEFDMEVDISQSEKNEDHKCDKVEFNLNKFCTILEDSVCMDKVIEGKDVLLFVGPTGGGKTSTILYLCGAEFQDSDEGYTPINVPKELLNFAISHKSTSCTSSIHATEDLVDGQSLVLCDTPGFGDTGGVEFDFANNLNLIRTVHLAKSVKPTVVLNASCTADRFRPLLKTLDTLTRMMSNSDDADLSAISFVFTDCSPREGKKLRNKLLDLQSEFHQNKQQSSSLLKILDAMIKSSTPSAKFINLLEQDNVTLKRALIQSKKVQDPHLVFSYFASEKPSCYLRTALKCTVQDIRCFVLDEKYEEAHNKIQMLTKVARLVPAGPKYILDTFDMKDLNNHFMSICEVRVKSLIALRKPDRTLFDSNLQKLDKAYSTTLSLNDLVLACGLQEAQVQHVSKCAVLDLLVKEILEYKHNSLDADTLTWKVYQLHQIVMVTKIFREKNADWDMYSRTFDFMSYKIDQELQFIELVIVNKPQAVVERFGLLPYFKKIIKLMKEYSIGDEEHTIPFESRTDSIVKNLKENIALSISNLLQVDSKQQDANKETLSTCSFDIQLGSSRSFLWNIKNVPNLFGSEINLGIYRKDVDESIKSYDDGLFQYLDHVVCLVEQRMNNLILLRECQVYDDFPKIQDEIKYIFEAIGNFQRIADNVDDWKSFDKKRLSALQDRSTSHLTQLKLYSDELDRASLAFIKEYNEASCSAGAFLQRCKEETRNLVSLLAELSLPENFESWSTFIKGTGTWYSRPFITVHRAFTTDRNKLRNTISEIVLFFQQYILFSFTEIYRWRPRLQTELPAYYLHTQALSLQLCFTFMKLKSNSELFMQISSIEISNQLLIFWNSLVLDFEEIQALPVQLCLSFDFDGLHDLLRIWKSAECMWQEMRLFTGMPPSLLAIQGYEYSFSEFQKHIQSCWNYKKLASECFVALTKVQEKIKEICFVSMIDSHWNDRLEYFNKVSILLNKTIGLQRLQEYLQNDDQKSLLCLEDEAMSKITNEMLKMKESLDENLLLFPKDQLSCAHIASTLHSFECIKKVFSGKKQKLSQMASEYLCDAMLSVENIMKNLYLEPSLDVSKCLEDLITLKRASNNIPPWSKSINLFIDEYLQLGFSPSNMGKDFIMNLSLALKAVKGKDSSIAQQLLSDHSVFEGMMNNLFDEATQGQDIHYVLHEVQGINDLSKSLLHEMYKNFESVYMSDIEEGIISRTAGSDFLSGLVAKTQENLDDYCTDYATQITIITAHIFAYWSLQTDNAKTISNLKFLKKPHAAQVVATLLMLNAIETEYFTLKNILVELKTGEGKSIVLGVAATCLAMFGADVDCVCYSSYLSIRDYNDFKNMFKAFDVIGKIRYGTIDDFSRKLLGDYSANSKNLMNGLPTSKKMFPRSRKPRVLLVDEVDVFFGKDVFGEQYVKCVILSNETVRSHVLKVWEVCGNDNHSGVHLFPESVIQSIPEASRELLNNDEAEKIWKAAKVVKTEVNKEYVISGDCIMNKHFDGLEEYVSYRYIKEALLGSFTMSEIESNLGIDFTTGSLSFAELPFEYDVVIGVTGTLKGISSLEKEILCNKYGIKDHVFVPSVYGSNKLNFTCDNGSDVIICDSKADFFLDLKHEIIKRQKQGVISDVLKRPVMIFFSNKKLMMEFYDSSLMTSMRNHTQIITEESSHEERTSLFLKATERGAVTLMIRGFGRGTDFKCFDKQMLTEGGVHVIQAFFSTEICEEIQIKGRTARQGANGSYSMVLLAEEAMNDLCIDAKKVQAMKRQGIYSCLVESRCKDYDGKVEGRIQKVKDAEAMHYRTLACRDSMRNLDQDECSNETRKTIISFFKELTVNDVEDTNAFKSNGLKEARLSQREKILMELHNAEITRRILSCSGYGSKRRRQETNDCLDNPSKIFHQDICSNNKATEKNGCSGHPCFQ